MRHSFLAILLIAANVNAQDKEAAKKVPDGVYAVLRDSVKETDVQPVKEGEVLVVHRHRFLKDGAKEPARFLVIHPMPEVELDLAEEPKADRDGKEVVRILLKLRPKAAAALERLTKERLDKHVAIILGGEVVTMHRIREVIRAGEVQITNCAPGATNHLLERLQAHTKSK